MSERERGGGEGEGGRESERERGWGKKKRGGEGGREKREKRY